MIYTRFILNILVLFMLIKKIFYFAVYFYHIMEGITCVSCRRLPIRSLTASVTMRGECDVICWVLSIKEVILCRNVMKENCNAILGCVLCVSASGMAFFLKALEETDMIKRSSMNTHTQCIYIFVCVCMESKCLEYARGFEFIPHPRWR